MFWWNEIRTMMEMNMKDIGGYFEMETYHGTEYHEKAISLNNARNCLRYLIRTKKIKHIFMPYFNCSAVIDAAKKENVELSFYHVDSKLRPIIETELGNDDFLYLINYFGSIGNDEIECYKRNYPNLIVDNVQAFFQRALSGIDTIYTCRKFFGVPDGAYLYTDEQRAVNNSCDKDTMFKLDYILGRYTYDSSSYFDQYHQNESLHDNSPILNMSKITHNILRSLDYDYIQKRRKLNYKILEEKLREFNNLSFFIGNINGPFCYPFYIKDGLRIRKQLAMKHIFIPVLWPNVLADAEVNSLEKEFVQNVLPIPCDQRYEDDDMHRIVDSLLVYLK